MIGPCLSNESKHAARGEADGEPFISSANPRCLATLVGLTRNATGREARVHIARHIKMCKNRSWEEEMATNLAIDPELLDEAHRIGGHRTKKATVTEALREYILRRKQRKVLDLFGLVDFDPTYDYKEQRARS